MSDETTVQLGHQELQDHNELVEYIRKLLEKIKLLTDLYDQNLTALTEHNESESSHPDLRILLAEGNDELQNQLDSFKDDITKKTDATDKRITDGLNDFDLRLRNAVEVNNVQNDRLTALEADVALKIYDKDVSAVGHTGQFDDILNRPNITISDATNEHTGNSIRITGGNTKLVLPSTITADLKGNVTGNVKGNVTGNSDTATKLINPVVINIKDSTGAHTGDNVKFDGSKPITIKLPETIDVDTTGVASSATKLNTPRTINVQDAYGINTGIAAIFDGTANAMIKLPAVITANVKGNVTGNLTGNADTATNATNATNSNAANQLQAFVNDNFTSGNHYVKAIRSSQGWSTHLWMCYNNGAKMADEVSVNYANNAGYASEATKATFDKDGKDISSYIRDVAITNGSDDVPILKVGYSGRDVYYAIHPVFPKSYNSVGSTILVASTTDYAGGRGRYGETVEGSALDRPYGLDDDGGQFNGSTPTCYGTWVRVSGWSGNGRTIGLWRRIA